MATEVILLTNGNDYIFLNCNKSDENVNQFSRLDQTGKQSRSAGFIMMPVWKGHTCQEIITFLGVLLGAIRTIILAILVVFVRKSFRLMEVTLRRHEKQGQVLKYQEL